MTLPYHERNWSETCVSALVCLRLWLDAAASTEAVAAAADVVDLVVAAAAAAASAAACRLDEASHFVCRKLIMGSLRLWVTWRSLKKSAGL